MRPLMNRTVPALSSAESAAPPANGAILLRDACGEPARSVRVAKIVTICGVEGFAIYRAVNPNPCLGNQWVVSHASTGGAVAWGRTMKAAVHAAEQEITAAAKRTGQTPEAVLRNGIKKLERLIAAVDARRAAAHRRGRHPGTGAAASRLDRGGDE